MKELNREELLKVLGGSDGSTLPPADPDGKKENPYEPNTDA
jgi:hypothetical protein